MKLLGRSVSEKALRPFRFPCGLNKKSLVIFIVINLIVFFNVISHEAFVIYDSGGHYTNIKAYSEFRFPGKDESFEYHSAPIAYIIPAISYKTTSYFDIGEKIKASEGAIAKYFYANFLDQFEDTDLAIAGKAGQFQLLFVSLILGFYLAKVTRQIHPDKPEFQFFTFLMLSILPVYYRTFSFIRGEPFVAMWTIILAYYFIDFLKKKKNLGKSFATFGLLIGMATLSRHFGAFLGVALVLYLLPIGIGRIMSWKDIVMGLSIAATISLAIASLFYAQYYIQNGGSFTPSNKIFSRYEYKFDVRNLAPSFYYSLTLEELFVDPIRPSFTNQFIPRFYADTFGDYSGYFLSYGWNVEAERYTNPGEVNRLMLEAEAGEISFPPEWLETNRVRMGQYLGQVMILALVPFFLLVAGTYQGATIVYKNSKGVDGGLTSYQSLFFWIIIVSIFGILIASIMQPTWDANLVKATYVVQIFPLAAILVAEFILGAKKALFRKATSVYLIAFFIFSFSAYFTKYISWLRY
jgi:hypothetical protein